MSEYGGWEKSHPFCILYIIEERTSMTEIFVVKKRSDVEGISNFYSIKISTAKNKFVKLKEANGSCKKIILEWVRVYGFHHLINIFK